MGPNAEQQRPVLSIDLGASYTKLAWRPRWKFNPALVDHESQFVSDSVSVEIGGAFYVPSIVLDPGKDGQWQFGMDAARSTPGAHARVFKNWKSTLFNEYASVEDVKMAMLAAQRFLEWLKMKLRHHYQLDDAIIRLCVPEFDNDIHDIGCQRLREAFKAAKWSNLLLPVSEPKANTIGLFSTGKNHVSALGDGCLVANMGQIYRHSCLITEARNVGNGAEMFKLVTIDIGAFTTDLAVCSINASAEVKIEHQKSFKHGVACLDAELEHLIRSAGIEVANSHEEFEEGKKTIYEGKGFTWFSGTQSITLDEGRMMGTITQFANRLLEHCLPHCIDAKGFILTGGGSQIQSVSNRIRERLKAAGLRSVSSVTDLDHRTATALGGASVVLDFSDFGAPSERIPLQPPLLPGRACECDGGNKECVKCQGTGWLTGVAPVAKLRSGDRQPLAEFVPTDKPSQPEDEVLPKRVLRNVTPKPSNGGLAPGSKPPNILEPDERIDVSEIVECLRGQESKVTQQFGLEGWMGQLVFGAEQWSAESRRRILQDHSSATGKAAWLRLLCLGTCLGVRAQPRYIKSFWENKLPEIWRVLIPTDLDQLAAKDYERKLNDVFVNAIHREFNDMRATGEDAELWRRIFYDFRKLHHFVYLNDLPCSLLELARQPGLPANALVNFLKSGFLPSGNKRWVGAIGQSMTAPLLFLLRELRRLAMIDARFDASCFYMNSPARRVARQLKWISERESTWFDIESLVEMSRTCHERMKTEMPELLPFFDLPLQWFAFNNSR